MHLDPSVTFITFKRLQPNPDYLGCSWSSACKSLVQGHRGQVWSQSAALGCYLSSNTISLNFLSLFGSQFLHFLFENTPFLVISLTFS